MSEKIIQNEEMTVINRLRNEGKTFRDIADRFGVHETTVIKRYYKWIKKQESITKEQEEQEQSLWDKIKNLLKS